MASGPAGAVGAFSFFAVELWIFNEIAGEIKSQKVISRKNPAVVFLGKLAVFPLASLRTNTQYVR